MDEGFNRAHLSGRDQYVPRQQDLVGVKETQRTLVLLVLDLLENPRQQFVGVAT